MQYDQEMEALRGQIQGIVGEWLIDVHGLEGIEKRFVLADLLIRMGAMEFTETVEQAVELHQS